MRPEFFPSSLKTAFRRIAFERGVSSESLAKTALENLTESIEWIDGFRKATPNEDRKKGIDFVIKTDVGKIFLQVKSSDTGKNESLKKHPKIPVVVISRNFDLEEIRSEIFTTLSEQRSSYLDKRLSNQEIC